MSAMELPRPDRATAEADRRLLADMPPDADCRLPASRVRSYVDAYLDGLPVPDSLSVPGPTEMRFDSAPANDPFGIRAHRALIASAANEPPRPSLGELFEDPRAFLPKWDTCVLAAIGVALIVAVNLLFDGGLEAIGEFLVTSVIGLRAAILKWDIEARRSLLDGGDDVSLPLAGLEFGWAGTILMFLGWLAAVAALGVLFYAAPRLVGFDVDLLAAGLAAVLILGLLALEWGLLRPEHA
jgi:hypothetical protein